MLSNRAAMLTPSPIRSPSFSATRSLKMNSDAEFDASFIGFGRVPRNHGLLYVDRTADRVDHAAKLDENSAPVRLWSRDLNHRPPRCPPQNARERPARLPPDSRRRFGPRKAVGRRHSKGGFGRKLVAARRTIDGRTRLRSPVIYYVRSMSTPAVRWAQTSRFERGGYSRRCTNDPAVQPARKTAGFEGFNTGHWPSWQIQNAPSGPLITMTRIASSVSVEHFEAPEWGNVG